MFFHVIKTKGYPPLHSRQLGAASDLSIFFFFEFFFYFFFPTPSLNFSHFNLEYKFIVLSLPSTKNINYMKTGITVLSLFDGISCGRVALERVGIKVDTYFASEIKPSAIKCSKDNWSDIIQIGDVTKVSYDKGILKTENGEFKVAIDLVIGGSPCFTEDTNILTTDGYKKIKDVSEDDMVVLSSGNYKVLRTGNTIKETIYVKTQGSLLTETTNNHPYYVRTKSNNTFSEPYWKEASKLEKGDYVTTPKVKSTYNYLYELSDDELFVLGRYIADGHTRKDYRTSENRDNDRYLGLILSIGKGKEEFIKDKIKDLHYSFYNHTQSVSRMVFSNKKLVDIVEKECGCGAINKKLSYNILSLTEDKLRIVLDGVMSGDGSFDGTVHKLTTISKELAQGLCLAVSKVYNVGCSINFTKRPDKHIIEGRLVNQHDTYMIMFREKSERSKYHIIDGEIWYPVHSVCASNKCRVVYNLEIDSVNMYTANNVVVHNCQDFSIANKNITGLAGLKSRLFYHYHRILKEVNPTYFLLENVKMKKEYEDVINEYMGVNPIKIDSKRVCGALRKRLYWTNIPNIEQPVDRLINLQDVLEYGYTPNKKAYCLMEGESRPLLTPWRIFHRWFAKSFWNIVFVDEQHYLSCKEHYLTHFSGMSAFEIRDSIDALGIDVSVYDGIRYVNKVERCRLQTLDDEYCRCLSVNDTASVCGDGWTVDVIAHIFKSIK